MNISNTIFKTRVLLMLYYWYIKQALKTTEGAIKTDNIDEDEQSKNTTQYDIVFMWKS